ncbi:MAG TPA: FAD-dependent oxidoreductase [Chloroflexota bacterium]|nr:FAD-dependent oxidoreductase [Chloroflexota bacterium]
MDEAFDIVVIGGGGAGYAAASTAARLGRRVAMIERAELGGTCLNRGCVPTKTLLRSAQVMDTIRRAADFGIDVGRVRLDYARVRARKDAVIRGFSGDGPLESLARQGITLLRGTARFEDARHVSVDGVAYAADRFVICSGSAARIPDLPGLADAGAITSTEALALEALPRTAVIVGGGIIACEFASLWSAFGVQVTIVGERLLSGEDEEVGATLADAFARRGIRLARGRAERLARRGDARVVYLRGPDGPAEVSGDLVLLATGRRAQYDGLNLAALGVATDARGIVTDAGMRTNVPNVWAAGDVTGRHMYTHSGDYGAEIAAWNAAGGEPERRADFRVVPRPVFALPEVAAVGLTERQAHAAGRDVETARVCYGDVSKAVIQGDDEGFCKIVADRGTGEILGGAIVGAGATDLIGELVVAMAGHVNAYTVGDAIHPYPTLAELVRWTADQIGKHLPPGEQVRRAEGTALHPDTLGCWPERGAACRAQEHVLDTASR